MKKVNLVVVVLWSLLILPTVVRSQCPNLSFNYGTLANWQYYRYSCDGIPQQFPFPPVPSSVDVMVRVALEQQGKLYDEYCPLIPKVPNGYNFSCRLGNSDTSTKIDGLEYEMTVNSNSSLLLLSFAWVMEKSNSPQGQQSQFSVKIKDSSGKDLDIPVVFETQTGMQGLACDDTIQAQPWTTVGISLESFLGRRIKLYIETKGCTAEHFAYAYVVAECRPMQIELAYCNGQNVASMKAPDGFTSYTWKRSSDSLWTDSTQQINILFPPDGEIFTCTVKNEFGSESQLQTVIARTAVVVNFMFGVKDNSNNVCFPCNNYKNWYDTCTRTVTFVEMAKVFNSKKSKILWEIVGTNVSSNDSMFTYTFLYVSIPTTYQVRLTVFAENGCADTFSQLITIIPPVFIIVDSVYAHFTTLRKTYCNNTSVAFTNQSNASASQLSPCFPNINLLCEWDYGDGSPIEIHFFTTGIGSPPSIQHQYDFPNKETKVVVTLTVWSPSNPTLKDVFTDTLTIIRPIANFTDDGHKFPCIGNTGKMIQFKDSSVSAGNITYYTWTFGDSYCDPISNRVEGDALTNPSHVYEVAGYYNVMLIVEDEIGCVDTMFKYRHVNIDGPAGTFTYFPLSGCVPLSPVTFDPNIQRGENGMYTADTVIWFPNGITPVDTFTGSQVNNPYRCIFKTSGFYLPRMEMIKWVNNNGTKERCMVTKQGIDTIWAIDLNPDFIVENGYGLDTPVVFINTTTIQPSVLQADSIHWDYGNNDHLWIYNTATESHNGFTTYNSEGAYNVTLTEYYKMCNQSRGYNIEVVKDLGIFEVTSYELQVTSYEIYDMLGRKLLSLPSPQAPFNSPEGGKCSPPSEGLGEALPAGIYIIRMKTNKGTITKKIVKH